MGDPPVTPPRQPDTIEDPLTAVRRSGARRLLAQAIEAEAEAFLAEMKGARLPDGRERLVRHGHGPERQVDRKSTRLNSSHANISYAVFCLKKKTKPPCLVCCAASG